MVVIKSSVAAAIAAFFHIFSLLLLLLLDTWRSSNGHKRITFCVCVCVHRACIHVNNWPIRCECSEPKQRRSRIPVLMLSAFVWQLSLCVCAMRRQTEAVKKIEVKQITTKDNSIFSVRIGGAKREMKSWCSSPKFSHVRMISIRSASSPTRHRHNRCHRRRARLLRQHFLSRNSRTTKKNGQPNNAENELLEPGTSYLVAVAKKKQAAAVKRNGMNARRRTQRKHTSIKWSTSRLYRRDV